MFAVHEDIAWPDPEKEVEHREELVCVQCDVQWAGLSNEAKGEVTASRELLNLRAACQCCAIQKRINKQKGKKKNNKKKKTRANNGGRSDHTTH